MTTEILSCAKNSVLSNKFRCLLILLHVSVSFFLVEERLRSVQSVSSRAFLRWRLLRRGRPEGISGVSLRKHYINRAFLETERTYGALSALPGFVTLGKTRVRRTQGLFRKALHTSQCVEFAFSSMMRYSLEDHEET